MLRPRLLIVDDQRDVLTALRLALTQDGIDVVTTGSPPAALVAVAAEQFDAALIDLNYTRDTTSGVEGLSLLEQLRRGAARRRVRERDVWPSIL
jgi:CheY-like chemotaxis protein